MKIELNNNKVFYNKGYNVFEFIANFEDKKINPINSKILLVAKLEDDFRTASRVSNY